MTRLLKAAVAALGLLAAASSALAADWTPPGPVKMIIAFRAGGGADTQARLIAEELEARHGWKIIPEQVTGKGGINAALALKDQPADGTAIAILVTETLGYNMAAAKGSGLSPTDFTGLTTTAGFQMGIVSKADSGYKTLADVIEAAKGGAEIRFGVMSPRLADLAYIVGRENGVDFNIISVQGGKAVMDGVNAGDMDVGFMAGIQAKGVAAGDLVNLASALSVPLVQTPDAPTLDAFGVEYNADGQFVFVGPANMDVDAASAISSAIAEIVSDPTTKAGGMIKKAFGGSVVIAGDELNSLLVAGYEGAGKLMADAAN